MGMPKILVGIITYEPNIIRFAENIREIAKQIDDIVVVDNNSSNIEEIKKIYNKIIKNASNVGVAKALIQIMEYANEHGYDWVLTLDQDSVVMHDLIEKYKSYIENYVDKSVAILTCLIKDRNFSDIQNEEQATDFIEVPYCITSGMLCNVQKYFKTSGYDETFFIDCVDFDLCYTFREFGYKIVRLNFIGLLHEVGCGKNIRILGKDFIVYNESPYRIFYITRNYIKLYKKHRKSISLLELTKKELFMFIRIIFFESNKLERLYYFFKGILTIDKK